MNVNFSTPEKKEESIPTKYLHISEINQFHESSSSSNKKQTTKYITPKKSIYTSMMCELAFSAKKYIDDKKLSEEKNEILLDKKLEKYKESIKFDSQPPITYPKRCSISRKSKISLSPPNKEQFKLELKKNQRNEFQDMEYREDEKEKLLDNYILYENYSEQSDIVYEYLKGTSEKTKMEKEIFKEWIKALSKEERGQKLYYETIQQYGWHPKLISVQKIEHDIDKIYGNGYNRRLKPGEEATIIETILKFIDRCQIKPENLLHSTSGIVSKILKKCEMEELIHFPFCIKQIEIHWKIMITRFRCSENSILNNKLIKIFKLPQCKNHFINLSNKNNVLVLYLLKYSKEKNIDSIPSEI